MSADGFSSDLARELAPQALECFLRYVRIDTQSDPTSTTYPSTAKQLDLSRLLVQELRELGLADATLSEHGYVFATLPATVAHPTPVVGLLAHVDTSDAVSGANVQPLLHEGYDGGRIELPGDPSALLDPSTAPDLAHHVGHTIVTSDGTTLLGADDKAGVAEIMAAAAYLVRHPEVPHGTVRIAFTVDEEVGSGVAHFDLATFGADVAYTLDGSRAGEIEDETFSAIQATVTIRGHSVHPGSAKGRLVNPIKLVARLIERLPADSLSPETTEGREGFVHPLRLEAGAEEARLVFIVRDHDDAKLLEHESLLRRLADEIAAEEPRAQVRFDSVVQYRNMKAAIDRLPRAVTAAEEAIRRAGLEPRREIIRGGTDGSRLSELGLPTPNLFTGGHDYHSCREWICVQDMGAATATIVQLVQVWAE